MESATRRVVRKGVAGAGLLAAILLARDASAVVTISFEPQNGVIIESVPADTLTVVVSAEAGADTLKGFSLILEFDPAYVTPIAAEAGSGLEGPGCDAPFFAWLNAGAIGDSIAVDGAALSCFVSAPGALAEIKFVGVPGSYGISPLACRMVRLRGPRNQVLADSCVAGTIEHKPVVIGMDPRSWGRVKGLYR